ncbi:MAG: CvpA family protein [Ardenticatenaceae bacterium]
MINNKVDILLILIVLYNILRGWQSGLIIGLLNVLSWAGSLWAAFTFYNQVTSWLEPLLALPQTLVRPIAFLLIVLVVGILFSLLSRLITERIPAPIHTHDINRIFGLVTGLVGGLVVIATFSWFLLALPFSGHIRVAVRDSGLANHFSARVQEVESELTPIFEDAITQTLNLMTIHPESNELVELPYTVNNAVPVPQLEKEMLELVNGEREKVGLPPLEMDPELIAVARNHSNDMFRVGYFSHNTPEGITPFDRIQAGGISYSIAGENLAHAPTLSIAHIGLMDSPGHRENILRPEFGRIGIGILDGGSRGLMITQNFRD